MSARIVEGVQSATSEVEGPRDLSPTTDSDGGERGAIVLGRIAGIRVKVRFTWVVFALVSLALTIGFLPGTSLSLKPQSYLLLAFLSTPLLLISVLVHELSHALIAKSRGIKVAGITLFLLGGYCEIDGDEYDEPADEILVYVAGPISSLALAGFFYALTALPTPDGSVFEVPRYVAMINLVLAIVNLVPGLPLDGGRVLRAVIWKMTGNALKATNWTSAVGQGFAFVLAAMGVYLLVDGNYLNGVWNLFCGGFLNRAAASCRQQPTLNLSYRRPAAAIATAPLRPATVVVKVRETGESV